MFKSLITKTIAIIIAISALNFAVISNANASLGSGNSTISIASNRANNINNTLGSSALTLSGYNADQILLAVISTSAGTAQISSTAGLSLVTGYQNPLTAAAASIAFAGTQANINAALNSLTVSPGTSAATGKSLTLTVSNRGSNSVAYNPENGHYYEFINTAAVNWVTAFREITGITISGTSLSSAQVTSRQEQSASSGCAKTFNGLCGYFATSTSAAENNFITTKVGTSPAWIGGSDLTEVNKWVWFDPKSPEYNMQFSQGATVIEGKYSNWKNGEPNGGSSENATQILSGGEGKWNDLREAHTDPAAKMGYVVEYGGAGTESQTIASQSRTVNFNILATNVASFDTAGTGTNPAEGWYLPGETFVLPSGAGLSKPGFIFDGWYEGAANYPAGATYTMGTFGKTFQAQWKEEIPVQTDTVNSVSPAQGVQGTLVTITGSFSRKVTEIKVDSAIVNASGITQTATTLSFAMPRHLYGAATIYVINGAKPDLKGLAFKYLTAAEASAAATATPSPTPSASASATPTPSASPTSSPSPSSTPKSTTKAIVPFDGNWGTVTFSGGGSTLTADEKSALNVLLKGIADMAGTKVVKLQYIKITDQTNKTEVKNFTSAVTARRKLITDALKALDPSITIGGTYSNSKAPSNLKKLKSDLKWLQIKINLKVS